MHLFLTSSPCDDNVPQGVALRQIPLLLQSDCKINELFPIMEIIH